MFLDFTKGHWVDLYGQLWLPAAMPEPELRTMTMDLPDGTVLPDNVPNARRQSFTFFCETYIGVDRDAVQNPKNHLRQWNP
jgi:hypothetical protein